jgi:diguanylate cyclase (GGDEF)-like protein
LCKLANIVGSVCRSGDTAFRHGPREFAILLPETASAGAQEVTTRLAERLAAEAKDAPLNVDAGIAVFPQNGPTLDDLVRAARRSMKKLQLREPRQFAKSA